MKTLGAELTAIAPGEVTIQLPFRADLTQQHGYVHGGVITAIVDTACGYAALSVMPPATAVLTVEFKVNLLAPATGPALLATGRVLRAGATLTVCTGEVWGEREGRPVRVAVMQATMMTIRDRPGAVD
jgi:uncharacterized protein (TIGR00369 family)